MAKEGSGKLPEGDKAGFTPRERGYLFIDVAGFVALVHSCFGKVHRAYKRVQIRRILEDDWVVHYEDKVTGRRVLAEGNIEHEHERDTAIFLAQMDYDVVFAPAGMFRKGEKKFDIFLIRNAAILKADIKTIYTKNPDNIAKRIKEGSEQASYIIINIASDVQRKTLIDGLIKGVERNNLIKEIFVIYKKRLYKFSKYFILNEDIFDIIK